MLKNSSFLLFILLLTGCAAKPASITEPKLPIDNEKPIMLLGNFSVSLAVKDIAVSRTFYEKLGFTVSGGDQQKNWLIMQNGNTKIGLFEGMFEGNILTFNPGWDKEGKPLAQFNDVRELQAELQANDIVLTNEADAETTGPASFMLADPDGNQILIDQHVPAPD